MTIRYLAMLAVTSLALLALGAPSPRRPLRTRPPASVRDLYSRQALRRTRTILQLKLLELPEERLERVRKVIERTIPIDDLFQEPLIKSP